MRRRGVHPVRREQRHAELHRRRRVAAPTRTLAGASRLPAGSALEPRPDLVLQLAENVSEELLGQDVGLQVHKGVQQPFGKVENPLCAIGEDPAHRTAHLVDGREVGLLLLAQDIELALLFLDLDRFKTINDTLGHGYGDELLRSLARRLPVCVREQDTVARLGGDEFVVLLNGIEDPQVAAQVAERILASVCEPMHIGGHELQVTPSIGISLYPDDGHDAATLMKHADLAMYEAKGSGRDQVHYFTEDLNLRAQERLHLETSLRNAIERNELANHPSVAVFFEYCVIPYFMV